MGDLSASIDELDDYITSYYEDDIDLKISTAKKILLLTLDMKNMEHIVTNDSLLSLLSRTLQEEYEKSSKSTELCINILCIFFVISNYFEFHSYLTLHKVGDATFKVIEYQIRRFDFSYAAYMEIDPSNKAQQERELRKLNLMIAKQDKLFYISFTILLNLAEDYQIEKKMKNRKIVSILVRMLERNDFHLLIVVLLFLRKLSIITENKNQMLEEGIVEKLGRFFSCQNNLLLKLSSGLLKNVAFDKSAREQIEKENYIPKIIDLLKVPNFRFDSLVLLYILSFDDKIRNTFAYTDCMPLVIKLITHFPEQLVGKELVALAINLAANQKNADLVSEEDLSVVIDRALKNVDINLFKFIKNIAIYAQDEDTHTCLQNNLGKFLKLIISKSKIQDPKIEDLKFEVIGILANIKFMGDKWENYLNNTFMEFLHANISQQVVEDDIILETVQLIQSICNSPKSAETLAKNNFMILIAELLISKHEDEEFLSQNIFALYQFLHHKIGIQFILEQQEILMVLLNIIGSTNQVLKQINDDVLDILREYHPDLSESIKEKKYYEYNREWIESVEEYDKNVLGQDRYDFGDDINGEYFGFYDKDDGDLDPRMWDSDLDM
ncbi:hypothetical protein ABPG72_007248 [Tetrahymena utriculariae]